MSRVRYVIAAASVLVVLVGMAVVVAVDSPAPGSHYVPGSLPPLADGDEVEVSAISEEGLREPGALDPVPVEDEDHEFEPTLAPVPSESHEHAHEEAAALPLVALTAPLPVAADEVYVMGVTWGDADAVAIDARYLVDGEWGTWQALGVDGGTGPDGDEAAAVPGTEPFIVSGAAALQVRASADAGVPEALTVRMFTAAGIEEQVVDLDPDLAALAAGPGGVGTSINGLPHGSLPVPEQPLAGLVDNPMPTIHLRAEWGPRAPSGEFDIGTVRGIAVHHTAGNNSYDADDVPAILRAIQRYHMDGRDWYDIGYNFLIDKYGRIWEGRAGGVTNTIKGVHSHSFNGLVTGVSLMGNFESKMPTSKSRLALIDLISWKLTLHGVSADGRILHPTEGAFPAIIGHRDIPEAATACPGINLYRWLPELRDRAPGAQGLPSLPLNLDANGDGIGDFVHVVNNSAIVYESGAGPAIATAPFAGAETFTAAVAQYDQFAGGPTLDGNVGAEILARRTNDGLVFRIRDKAKAKPRLGLPTNLVVPAGHLMASPGDLTGDGDADVVVVNPATGVVSIHPGDGTGVLGTPSSVDPGTGAVSAVEGVGDANGDGDADLAVVDTDGAVWYLLGDGEGGLTAQATDAAGLAGYDELAAVGDLTGDGIDDLLARRSSSGAARTVVGGPSGATGEVVAWDSGVATWRHPVGAPGWGGDPSRTLLAVSQNGQYLVQPTPGSAELAYAPSDRVVNVSGLRSASLAGDYDGDGIAELMTLDDSGELRLHFGGAGGFGSSVVVPDPYGGGGWDEYLAVTAAGDYNFDGTPDLAVTDIDGDVLVFTWDPSDPTLVVGPRRVDWGFDDYAVVGVGAWAPGSIADLVLVSPTGDVDVLAGKGMTGARTLKSDAATLPAGAELIPLGQLPGFEGAAALVFDPATGTFAAYGWTSSDPWAPLPQVTVSG